MLLRTLKIVYDTLNQKPEQVDQSPLALDKNSDTNDLQQPDLNMPGNFHSDFPEPKTCPSDENNVDSDRTDTDIDDLIAQLDETQFEEYVQESVEVPLFLLGFETTNLNAHLSS
ncbi:unnamed protein product [Rhizoctonia solani]|uniref:Uncharacterized protein n=1 Tax=Rhizoctonia solani TaxID=456999 RepID=A0A8H2W9L7_9AGAM|nr:unnamed protein product [Rhizoctonia solani]